MKILWMSFIFLLSSCTYSVIMNHTEGTATDMVDENQTAQPNVSPTINVPLTP